MDERKFELVSKYNDEKYMQLMPQRTTAGSAGYDFKAVRNVLIMPHGEPVLVPTGIKVQMSRDNVLLLFNRSSNPLKRNLVVPNGVGVIDSDYYNNDNNEGEIFGQFINIGDTPVEIKFGQKIMQGIFMPYCLAVNDVSLNMQRNGGFGSTDRLGDDN